MKKLIIITFTTLLITVVSSSEKATGAAGGLGGDKSCHNFSHESWLPVRKICRVCQGTGLFCADSGERQNNRGASLCGALFETGEIN